MSSSPHFVLFHSYSIARKDIQELDILNLPESELCTKPGKDSWVRILFHEGMVYGEQPVE